jgi:hypothetical protein
MNLNFKSITNTNQIVILSEVEVYDQPEFNYH